MFSTNYKPRLRTRCEIEAQPTKLSRVDVIAPNARNQRLRAAT
jgi:hypothetical protein